MEEEGLDEPVLVKMVEKEEVAEGSDSEDPGKEEEEEEQQRLHPTEENVERVAWVESWSGLKKRESEISGVRSEYPPRRC